MGWLCRPIPARISNVASSWKSCGRADSLKTRFTPHASDGDIYITSVWTSGLYRLNLRQDGTYWYEAKGDKSRQFILADLRSSTGLNGEGTLAVNDDPPRPDTPGGTLFSNAPSPSAKR
jgi:hypothetical protein